MFDTNHSEWASLIFGNADLGDPRRNNRLVKIATDMATHVGDSVSSASNDSASIEGAYRFIRNDKIKPEDIAQAGFLRTDEIVKNCPLVLAIQDTSGLSYRHSVCLELGDASSSKSDKNKPKGRTLFAHSTLMIDANSEQVLGIANQHYWFRETKNKETKEVLQARRIEDKESFKWQKNMEELSARMGSMANVIDVCDREADIYEYFAYQQAHGHRFLVRAKDDRLLNKPKGKLSELVLNSEPNGFYQVNIPQKGGRPARQAEVALNYQKITIKKPKRVNGVKELSLNMVICREVSNEQTPEKLCWILYTSEPIDSMTEARQLVRYYELRWRIEEFHKVWKSDGTQVEKLRMQKRENLKRVAVIQAFIAVRLMQLQGVIQNKEWAKEIPCTPFLSTLSWKCLWLKTEKKKALPTKKPSLYWAYYAIAKLGGWYDSKRTGKVGMKVLWRGWQKLMEQVESIELFKELERCETNSV